MNTRKNRTAKLRSGAKAHYQVRHGRITSQATARYEIISIRGVRADISATVSAKQSSNFTGAYYPGEVKQLLLSRAEQALFDSTQEGRKQQQLDRALADTLAARIAKQVVRHLQ